MSPWTGTKQVAAAAERDAELQHKAAARAAKLLAEHQAEQVEHQAAVAEQLAAAATGQQHQDGPQEWLSVRPARQSATRTGTNQATRRWLTADQRADVLTRWAAGGVTQVQLAAELGFSKSTICQTIRRAGPPATAPTPPQKTSPRSTP